MDVYNELKSLENGYYVARGRLNARLSKIRRKAVRMLLEAARASGGCVAVPGDVRVNAYDCPYTEGLGMCDSDYDDCRAVNVRVAGRDAVVEVIRPSGKRSTFSCDRFLLCDLVMLYGAVTGHDVSIDDEVPVM